MPKDKELNPKVSKVSKLRRQSRTRLIVIVILMVIIAVMFVIWEKARISLVALFLLLLVALGLEVSGNDWDLGELIETGSFEESKVEKTDNGRWLINDERCNAEAFNCSNFEYQEDAQDLFEYCGGLSNDVHGLDGDNDGKVCEALKSKR